MGRNDNKRDAGSGPTIELSKIAAAKRRARKARQEERTTLEMTDPDKILGNATPDHLGEMLVAEGLITRHQLFNALNESYRAGIPLREAIIALGYVDADVVASVEVPEE